MKSIRVVAAVICDSVKEKHKIFATARGYEEFKGQWEFPGGKIEEGETPQQALKREIEEELDTKIEVYDLIDTIEYDYPNFHLSMDCFWCETMVINEDSNMISRMLWHMNRENNNEFKLQLEDIVKVGYARYEDRYKPMNNMESPFVLYEKYSRRDISLLMNCGKDLSSIMFGMKRILDDVFIFVTYHKKKAEDERNYIEGKPDYVDVFEDNMIFRWDSKIGMGVNSAYMKDVTTAPRKHLLVKKSDVESNFYYMGMFDIVNIKEAEKEDNKGNLKPISKVVFRMHHPVRDDLLCYLQSSVE